MHNEPSLQSLLLAGAATLAATLFAPSVHACGGFFCSRSTPVFQTAERIIFAQDGQNTTQIVEVMYEGPSEKFSWALPVPGAPEPSVSSKEVFNLLDGATAPRYRLERTRSCLLEKATNDTNFESSDVDVGQSNPPVTVLHAGSVGPFDFETISINVNDEPEAVAINWLMENGYDVTEETGAVLGPYLANGLNLIAFRLQKGQSTGAIRPIVLRYQAPKMVIPIRPTAVAANENMPVLVLGKDRAVPTNYRGLEINQRLIDWFNPAESYNKVVTAAANEAGGQGFVTELVTNASLDVDAVKPNENDINLTFELDGTLEDRIAGIVRRLGSWDGFIESASQHLQLRAGVTMEESLLMTARRATAKAVFGPTSSETPSWQPTLASSSFQPVDNLT